MIIVKRRNFILGYFWCFFFFNFEAPGIYDMLSEEGSYTFGSVVRSVGRVGRLEKFWKLEEFCEFSKEWH